MLRNNTPTLIDFRSQKYWMAFNLNSEMYFDVISGTIIGISETHCISIQILPSLGPGSAPISISRLHHHI